MIQNKVFFQEDSWAKLYRGVEIVAKAVMPTLGSRGRNVMFRPFKGRWPTVTNDGVSIARHIFLTDESEAMGADYIKQASERTNEQVGDGTTSVCLLAYYLITYGKKILDENKIGAPQLRKELEKAVEEATKLLSVKANKITTQEELYKIAKISSEDDTIAKIVSEAVTEAGENGRVIVEASEGLHTLKESREGFIFDQGFTSPFFITHPDKLQAIYKDAHVLIVDKKFTFNKEIVPILNVLGANDIRTLLIVCQDVQSEALATLLKNITDRNFATVCVKTPRDKEVMEDLAAYTGATVISGERNDKFDITKVAPIRKVIVSRNDCFIVKGDRTEAEKNLFETRLNALKEQIKDNKGDEKKAVQTRLANMTHSTVFIRAGAPLEQEMYYLKDKIDDAVSATNAAKVEGYVTGGGLTLKAVCSEVDAKLGTQGSKLLSLASEMPIRTLIANAGVEYLPEKINETDGFDTDTGKYTKNLIEKGVIDPVLVEKSILKNAASSAGIFLTLHCHLEGVYAEDKKSGV